MTPTRTGREVTLPTLASTTLEPGSPEWWVARLSSRLDDRYRSMKRFDDYYNGIQPLAFASSKFALAFGDRFPAFSSNFMSLVVDTHRQRLHVQGFRFGDEQEGDKDAWRFWQANDLDAWSHIAHTESLVKGVAYALVWLEFGTDIPQVTIEDPLQTIVEYSPGNRRHRRAALKRFVGDDDHMHATLYLPTGIYKFRSQQRVSEFSSARWTHLAVWEQRIVAGEEWPLPNPIGVVPIVAIPNRPRLTSEGQSELAPVTGNQDAINKLRADALIASEFAAFRQRWVIGLDIPTDPETGQAVEPFKAAVDRLWMVPPPDADDTDPPEVKFGEFEATDLGPYATMIGLEVQHLGANAQTPYHYLLPQSGQPPSGESLKSAETGLVAKVRDSQVHKGEAWEEVVRLNFRWLNDSRADIVDGETIWADPESRTEAAHTDALTKWKSFGIPDEFIWEELGLSPQQITRIKEMRKAAENEPPLIPVAV